MATIIGGIGTSHVPTIGMVYDRKKHDDPAWEPLFRGYAPAAKWLADQKPDVLVIFYNDHATRFFFDLYPTFALGMADRYDIADEGAGPRPIPPIPGNARLSNEILEFLIADGFDLAVFQGGGVDHGCHSPLPLLWPHDPDWPGTIVPIAINVLQYPMPTAKRCFELGRAVGRAVRALPDDLKVAIVGTGGLSHQVHGERTGFNNTRWDEEFLAAIVSEPEALTRLTHAEYVQRGGAESVEMIMWLAMRGALGGRIREVHRSYYLPTTTAMAVTVYEPLPGEPPIEDTAVPPSQRAGMETLDGTYPFDALTSLRTLELNRFLWRFTTPEHREAFRGDEEATLASAPLTEVERHLIRSRDWIGLIQAGASFFVLEKLARVCGVTNLEVYASMRGEELETFMATRRVPDAR